jgi:hypothetical protein
MVPNTICIRALQGRLTGAGYTSGVPTFPVPALPVVIELSLAAVSLGALVLLRLVGGSMPWGQLTIAVGPDGRPMRPRVKWHLWTICRGERPLLAAAAGISAITLGVLAIGFVVPRLADELFHPVTRWVVYLMFFTVGASSTVVPLGVVVLLRGFLDLFARRSSMVGVVVSMRRDVGVFGRTYRIAVQAGDRVMTKGLWAEAFRVNRALFDRLRPGDKVTVQYSPHLRYVYALEAPAPPLKRAG